jgi:diguanylate cyclase (GGDEF)-like protein
MMDYNQIDTSEAVELAPRVWWVGSLLPDLMLQCHAYLIEQGDESVLIDPGSALNADEIIRKIDSVVGLGNVRWLVCSQPGPDVTGALPALVARGLHPEAAIVTHWRDEALIIHSGTPLKFWRVDEHGWRLELQDRTLRFVLTPYSHSAGAFCTFDEESKTLFSSALFGSFDRDPSLFATSVDYFESMRSFHEQYMPSREILAYAIDQLRELPMREIAPHHGQVIPKDLIVPIMDRLEKLECGIYLLARDDPGLAFLLAANRTIHNVVDVLVREQQFPVVAAHLAEMASQLLGAEYLELWGGAGESWLQFEQTDGFAGHRADTPSDVRDVLNGVTPPPGSRLVLALTSPVTNHVEGAVVLGFRERPVLDGPTLAIIWQITGLVEVGLEREVLRRSVELERTAWHERATHDLLTGLYNRVSLGDAFRRLTAFDDRNASPQLAVLMIDIDHFKRVNDAHGHPTGDRVLQTVAHSITTSVRPSDLTFRFGGEEFLVLLSNIDDATAVAAAERIRANVASSTEGGPGVTMSVGVALRRPGEQQDALIARADRALYQAKSNGRDRVEVAQ